MALNSGVMTCTMPQVGLSSDFHGSDSNSAVSAGGGVTSLSGGPNDRDHADIYVGLLFDGFRRYDNLTAAMPNVTFQFYQPPTIDSFSKLITYRPGQHADINITVTPFFSYH